MKKHVAIIVGGTGQFGLLTARFLLKKNYKTVITSRSSKKKNYVFSFFKNKKNLFYYVLNIGKKKEIEKLVKKFNPSEIYFFAGQSSVSKSFHKKKETYFFSEGKTFVKGRENKMINLPFWFNFIAFTHGKNATDNLRNLNTPYDEGSPNFFDFFDITTKEIVKNVFVVEDNDEDGI